MTVDLKKAPPDDSPVKGRSSAVTAVLIALSLAFAFLANLYAWPDSNFPLALMIPVLIGMLRASPLGMRMIVGMVVIGDLAITSQTHPALTIWAVTVSTLIAVCYIALRVHSQRLEILTLQRTATERAERAEQREEQLVDFIDLVYHDVRLPLEAARIQLRVLRQGLLVKDPQWAKARSEDADVALGHMSMMLKDLFDIGRQEAGHLALQPTIIDLAGFLPALLDRLAAVLETERVGVDVQDGAVVEADFYQMERIVGNLVANGLKYSGDGAMVIVRVTKQSDQVVLSVVDRGIGIAAEDLAHVFERGYRGAEARSRADGAGLGLYAVRLLVEAHGGRVWAESSPGAGSAIHVALPAPRDIESSSPIRARIRALTP
jgi:signal transduction histidine kinase